MKLTCQVKSCLSVIVVALGLQAGNAVAANLVINGDFEATTAGATTWGTSNAVFTSLFTSVTAFGLREGIDLMTAGSGFGGNPQSGNWKVGPAADSGGNSEAFSMALSSATTAGESYDLSFYFERLNSAPFDGGMVQIGLSASPTSFGTLVYTSGLATDGWTHAASTFVAPISAGFLTVRLDNAGNRWVGIDNISLSQVPEPSSCLLFGVGALSLALRQKRKV